MASALFFFICIWVLLPPTDAVTNAGERFDWQILSARNYTSQIGLHPHALVFVTVPWSGQTRSLMRDLSHELANKQDDIGSLKLMVVYRNQNKELADSLGATEGISVLCYVHGVSYKYHGRLRMRDILYSMIYLMSLGADLLPFEEIRSSEDLDKFLVSTDKAVLLVESCEWTSKLLAEHSFNRTEERTSYGKDFARVSSVEVNQALESDDLDHKEAMGSEDLKCDADQRFGGAPWIPSFIVDNGTSFLVDHDEKNLSVGSLCSTKEYEKFSSFFLKFIFMTRSMFIPPQRQRFGLVSNMSLISSRAGEEFGAWSLIISDSACPNSSKIIKDEKQLQTALEVPNFSIIELMGDTLDDGPALPRDKPSVILFVDRLADSSDIRKKSKEALDAFKEVAVMCNASCQTNTYKVDWPTESATITSQRSCTVSQYSRTQLSAPSKNFNEKRSIMVIKDGKRVSWDAVGSESLGNSLQEILTYMLGENKQKTLRSIAKEVGFQLLSDDLDIMMTDEPPTHTAVPTSTEPSKELPVEREAEKVKDHDMGYSSVPEGHQQFDDRNSEPYNNQNKESTVVDLVNTPQEKGSDTALRVDRIPVATDEPVISIRKDLNLESSSVSDNCQEPTVIKSVVTIPVSAEPKLSSADESTEDNTFPEASDVPVGLDYEEEKQLVEQIQSQGLSASYFFSDGNYQLVTSLTGESKVPRMVIVDPIMQLHYVLPESKSFGQSSIKDAIDRFFNGSLPPYQRSGPFEGSKEFPHPPFVNLDFHEKYFIPSVTTNTFTELVLGSKRFNARNASNPWNTDVLVLFTNSWCGFCQRMNLVTGEVYRSLKGFMNQNKEGSKSGKVMFARDYWTFQETVARHFIDAHGRKLLTHLVNWQERLLVIAYAEFETVDCKENFKAIMSNLPVIYRIDCTLNDCSWILKTLNQRELYPSLLLFPAKRKNALLYDGDVAVNDIIKFIAMHGSNSFHLVRQKDERKAKGSFSFEGTFFSAREEEFSNLKEDHSHEVILKDDRVGKPKPVRLLYQKRPLILKPPNPEVTTEFRVTVGSFLVATEMLGCLSPFANGKILIVSADRASGFLGLMINKHMMWESLPELSVSDGIKKTVPLSFGGPVVQGESPFVALMKDVSFNNVFPEVLPGVYFLEQSATSEVIRQLDSGESSGSEFWFFLGYSGWGWDQLFDEISQGAWSLGDGNDEGLPWPPVPP